MPRSEFGSDIRELPINKPILLDNETCVYCGTPLHESVMTKEHVIGRRFVPKGKLAGQWNLIVQACHPCNQRKSELEDDLSAISMQPDMWGRHVTEDRALAMEAARKAQNSTSRRTKRPIKDSSETLTLKTPFAPGGEATFSFSAPPQADISRVFELSRLHLMAFFYWITYNRSTKKGGYWLGGYFPVLEAIRSDWGNPVHRAFMASVIDWEPRVLATGADGYFKVAIRRHPNEICWSWALEWNNNFRIVGFLGERAVAEALVRSLPPLAVATVAQWDKGWLRYRTEVPLPEDEDTLFCWNDTRLAKR